jgi:hypothetical protein
MRFAAIQEWLLGIPLYSARDGSEELHFIEKRKKTSLQHRIAEIVWRHHDIRADHLGFSRAIIFVDADQWLRNQKWDNIFSFYDPDREAIVLRADLMEDQTRFEVAFLVAFGQSLLGNYALSKSMQDVFVDGEKVGRMYKVVLRDPAQCRCYFNLEELEKYLILTRMARSSTEPSVYSRLINGKEGFTPPGLLFGLFYAWYLDNTFASHIEYKMSIMRNAISDLIPEQIRIVGRREGLVHFFRENVFQHHLPVRTP